MALKRILRGCLFLFFACWFEGKSKHCTRIFMHSYILYKQDFLSLYMMLRARKAFRMASPLLWKSEQYLVAPSIICCVLSAVYPLGIGRMLPKCNNYFEGKEEWVYFICDQTGNHTANSGSRPMQQWNLYFKSVMVTLKVDFTIARKNWHQGLRISERLCKLFTKVNTSPPELCPHYL